MVLYQLGMKKPLNYILLEVQLFKLIYEDVMIYGMKRLREIFQEATQIKYENRQIKTKTAISKNCGNAKLVVVINLTSLWRFTKLVTLLDLRRHMRWIVGTGHFWPTPIGSRLTSQWSDIGSGYSDFYVDVVVDTPPRLRSFAFLQITAKCLKPTSCLTYMSMRLSIIECTPHT